MPVGAAPRDAEQLHAVAELLGVADVGLLHLRDALDVGVVEAHRDAEGDGRHESQLVGGVDSLDVEGRVGLGVAVGLGVGEGGGEVDAAACASRRG